MITFTQLKWRGDRITHIASKHGVTPGEVEEVCFGAPFILRGPGKKKNCLYYVLGQTEAGRYLFVVIKPLGGKIAQPITAREMSSSERTRYNRR